MNRYALVDRAGVVDSVTLWDGVDYVAPVVDEDGTVLEPARGWAPPDGLELVALDDDSPVRTGDTIDKDGTVLEAAPALELELTLEERLAALESKLEQ